MIASGYDGEIFWTVENVAQHVRFSQYLKELDSDWMGAFCSYIHEVDTDHPRYSRTGFVHCLILYNRSKANSYRLIFPHPVESIVIGERTYGGDSSIAVTISDHLTFILPSEKRGRQYFQFIDIPLRVIVPKSVRLPDESTGGSKFCLRLELQPTGFYIMSGENQSVRNSSIDIKCNDDAAELPKAIEDMVLMVLKSLGLTIDEGTVTKSDHNEATQWNPRSRHMSGAFVTLSGEGDTASNLVFANRLGGNITGRPYRLHRTRSGSSAMISLATREEVVRKSTDFLKSIAAAGGGNVFHESAFSDTVIHEDTASERNNGSIINQIIEGTPSGMTNEEFPTVDVSELKEHLPIDMTNEPHKNATSERITMEETPAKNGQARSVEEPVDREDRFPYDVLDSQSDPLQHEGRPQRPGITDAHPCHQETVSRDIPDSLQEASVANEMSTVIEDHASPTAIPDSRGGSSARESVAEKDKVASNKDIPETEKKNDSVPKCNTQESLLFSSRLRRPRQKVYGVRSTRAAVKSGKRLPTDWDRDLRSTDDEPEPTNNKKLEKTPLQLPSASASKENKSESSQKKKQPIKPALPTPKTGSTLQKKRGKVAKPKVQKTLASSRPRRAAAEVANSKISTANDDQDVQNLCPPGQMVPKQGASIEGCGSEHVDVMMAPRYVDDNTADDTSNLAHDESLLAAPNPDANFSHPKNSASLSHSPKSSKRVISNTKAGMAEEATVDLAAVSDSNHADEAPDSTDIDRLSNEERFSGDDVTIMEHDQDIKVVESPSKTNPQNPRQHVEGRGRLMGNKLAEALSGKGIHTSEAAGISPEKRQNATNSVRNTEKETEDPLAADRREKLYRISQQISDFMSQSSVARPARKVAVPVIMDSPRSSKKAGKTRSFGKSVPDKVTIAGSSDKQAKHTGDDHATLTGVKSAEEISGRSNARSLEKTKQAQLENAEGRQPRGKLIDERLHRKTQIVSFAIDGPRNQGEFYRAVATSSATKGPQTPGNKHGNSAKRKMPLEPEGNQTEGIKEKHLTPYPKRKRAGLDSREIDTSEHMGTNLSPGRTEFLALSRPQLFYSQCSMVDENGSPRPITRRMKGSQIVATKGIAELNTMETSLADRMPQRAPAMSTVQRSSSQVSTEYDDESGHDEVSDDEHMDGSYSVSRIRFPKIYSTQNSPLKPNTSRSPKTLNPLSAPTENGEQCTPEIKRSLSFTQRLEAVRTENPAKSAGLQGPLLPVTKYSLTTKRAGVVMCSQDEEQTESDVEIQMPCQPFEATRAASTSSLTGSPTLVEEDNSETEWRHSLRATQRTTVDLLLDASKVRIYFWKLLSYPAEIYIATHAPPSQRGGCNRRCPRDVQSWLPQAHRAARRGS